MKERIFNAKKLLILFFAMAVMLLVLSFSGKKVYAAATPLTFTAEEAGATVTLNKYGSPGSVSLVYSKDGGATWSSYTIGTTITLAQNGDKVSFKAKDKNGAFCKDEDHNYYGFVLEKKVVASGNITTLLESGGTDTVPEYAFEGLFYGCESLTSAPELPATTLAKRCYGDMFSGCTSLTSAPNLPATTLADYCYYNMFDRCESLTSAPDLLATTLAESCYMDMFSGCSSLTSAPELSATTLAKSCYMGMFSRCSSLTSAPELPATTLAESCYDSMFCWCTRLTSTPALPATTLAKYCYYYMFAHCSSLTSAPALPATTLAESCYNSMFYECTILENVPDLSSVTDAGIQSCSWMFYGCGSLKIYKENTERGYEKPWSMNLTSEGWCWNTDMFAGTGGTFKGATASGATYYVKGMACTVSFDANDHGTAPAAQPLYTGDKVTKPEDPAATGYIFGGWYKEAACTNAWNFDTDTVTADTTLYAKWTDYVAVTGVTLNKTTESLTVGGTDTLTATVAPENATNKAVTWSSGNTAVATVDNTGKVTAVGAGTAVITVTTADGEKTATCTVTVSVAASTPAVSNDSSSSASAPVKYNDLTVAGGYIRDVTGVKEATGETNSCSAKIANGTELKTLLNVTDAQVAQGINVWLDVKDIGSTISTSDKQAIAAASAGYTISGYFDVSLMEKIGSQTAVQIYTTNGNMKISIKAPEGLVAGRTYYVVRMHDGKADILNAEYDAAAGTITFATDKFSTYAIVYKEGTAAVTSPKTGTDSFAFLFAVMAAAVMGGVVTVVKAKRR